MEKDEFNQYIDYINSVLIDYKLLEEEKESMCSLLSKVKYSYNDPNLYLFIIGEESFEKDSYIEALKEELNRKAEQIGEKIMFSDKLYNDEHKAYIDEVIVLVPKGFETSIEFINILKDNLDICKEALFLIDSKDKYSVKKFLFNNFGAKINIQSNSILTADEAMCVANEIIKRLGGNRERRVFETLKEIVTALPQKLYNSMQRIEEEYNNKHRLLNELRTQGLNYYNMSGNRYLNLVRENYNLCLVELEKYIDRSKDILLEELKEQKAHNFNSYDVRNTFPMMYQKIYKSIAINIKLKLIEYTAGIKGYAKDELVNLRNESIQVYCKVANLWEGLQQDKEELEAKFKIIQPSTFQGDDIDCSFLFNFEAMVKEILNTGSKDEIFKEPIEKVFNNILLQSKEILNTAFLSIEGNFKNILVEHKNIYEEMIKEAATKENENYTSIMKYRSKLSLEYSNLLRRQKSLRLSN